MIDVHCHLEQKDFEKDREEVIKESRKELGAVITCCCHPDDCDLTMDLAERHKGFVFPTLSIHPEYIKEFSEKQIEEFFKSLRGKKDKIVGIGETGLDYFWIKEEKWRKKQEDLFLRFIRLAKELAKPLVIHSRKAASEAIEILEKEKATDVLMHFFSEKKLLGRVRSNGWSISVNTMILKSKTIKKIVRDMPLEQIMTETDSPWLGQGGERNDPRSIRLVVQKIAEIKRLSFREADRITTENAVRFFRLPARLSGIKV